MPFSTNFALFLFLLVLTCLQPALGTCQLTFTRSYLVKRGGGKTARSAPPPPIKRLAHPSTLGLDIFPRRVAHQRRFLSFIPLTLEHSDSFRLTISAFNETFHLHLRPNDDLIHPSARIH